jgi:hypothetical protein
MPIRRTALVSSFASSAIGGSPAQQRHGRAGGEADGQLDQVQRAIGLQHPDHLDAVVSLQTAAEPVLHVQLGRDSGAVPGPGADGLDRLARETGAPIDVPAVLVPATVGPRRQELAEQVAVADVDLDGVEACLDGQPASGFEVAEQPVEVLLGRSLGERHGSRRERAGWAQGRLPGHVRRGEPPGVPQLDTRGSALRVDGICQAPQPPDRAWRDDQLVLVGAPLRSDGHVGEVVMPTPPAAMRR